MNSIFNKSILIFLFLFASVLSACAQSDRQSASLSDLGTIKAGYIPTSGYSPLYLGIEKGYFEEKGLKVELERFDSGSKMIAPLSAGQLDVGAGEPGTALFNSRHQGLDVMVVCGMSSQAPGYGGVPIIVRKDLYDSGELDEIAELKGRKVALNILHGMGEYIVAKAMEKAGMTIDDVELVTIAFPDTPAALANRAVDAATVPQLIAEKAIEDGIAVELIRGDQIAGEIQSTVMYFGKRFLDPANREVTLRFLEVWLKGLRELYDEEWSNPENLAIISKYTNLPPETIKNSAPKQSYYNPNCDYNSESLEDIQNYYLSRGYTEYTEALPLSQIVDDSFRKEVLDRIGVYQK